MLNPKTIKKDFPILNNNPSLAYLDSAATSLKPKPVIDAITEYYEKYGTNAHRGLYKLSRQTTKAYEKARETVMNFIHAAKPEEIIFTSGATMATNMVSQAFLKSFVKSGDEILVTMLEHHSNLVPWQIAAKKFNLKLTFWDITEKGTLNEEQFNQLLNKRVKLLAVTHVSNALGTINPLKRIIQKAHAAKIKVLVDAAQSIPHMPLDVQYLDCDFLAFSGHKMLGPTGIGVLYAKEKFLSQTNPFLYGGDMIQAVFLDRSVWNHTPWKFEAGTQNIAGALGLANAVEYLKNIGLANIREHEKKLLGYAVSELKKLPYVKLLGPLDPEIHSGVLSFTMENVHPHDIAALLDEDGIAIRAGHHCSMPLMARLKISATARISFHCYTTEEDIARFAASIKKIHYIFSQQKKSHASYHSKNGRRGVHRDNSRSREEPAQ